MPQGAQCPPRSAPGVLRAGPGQLKRRWDPANTRGFPESGGSTGEVLSAVLSACQYTCPPTGGFKNVHSKWRCGDFYRDVACFWPQIHPKSGKSHKIPQKNMHTGGVRTGYTTGRRGDRSSVWDAVARFVASENSRWIEEPSLTETSRRREDETRQRLVMCFFVFLFYGVFFTVGFRKRHLVQTNIIDVKTLKPNKHAPAPSFFDILVAAEVT